MNVYSSILGFSLVSGMDTHGVYGLIFHYALVFALVGSAFLVFIYFWIKGRLDMDEEPKMQMMLDEEKEDNHGHRI